MNEHLQPEAASVEDRPATVPARRHDFTADAAAFNDDMTYPSGNRPAQPATPLPERPAPQPEPPAAKAQLGRGFWLGLLIALLVLVAVVVYGIRSRSHADTALVAENKADSTPEVSVVHPKSAVAGGTLTLPGTAQAFVDTPIYARTSGYLKRWFFDIGAHVHKGQLLATIETPEVDQQVQAAEADLKSAQANLDLARTTADRYINLLKSNSVSRQETDVAKSNLEVKQAALEASQAGVRRLEQLQGFERVYAPFDGVITARNTDIGDLIAGGASASTNAKQLFHLAAIQQLRVFVAVPEGASGSVRAGGTAEVTADEYPGETFPGTIARNSSAIDPSSRTLNVEVDVPNGSGRLLPGAYVQVHFKIPAGTGNLSLPSNTLLFRAQGLQVGIVRNGKVQLQAVHIAADHGATVEIASGVQADDAVILDPSDSLRNGETVKVKADKK